MRHRRIERNNACQPPMVIPVGRTHRHEVPIYRVTALQVHGVDRVAIGEH